MASTKVITRKSLGRGAFIGSLYNVSNDTFCGTTIFKSKYPDDSIRKVDISHTEILYEYENTYKEKFNKLDVEAELKLSVLTGLIPLEGSGKYLNDEKDSLKSVKGTLIYKITSVEENLVIHRDDVKACISTDVFTNNQNATHVVIGIKWGAAIMASFECKDTNEENRSHVEGALKCHFEKIKISGGGHVDNAKSGDIEVLIPPEFTYMDDNYETVTIKLGNYDSNKPLEEGESSTRECESYVFHLPENRLIRLIDTPGIGDTRGSEYDKKNCENILWYISHYQYLNGICILLKPNNSRYSIVFKYCILELLTHLHKSAKDNIVFCFTNTRETHYRPGNTLQPLKEQLEKLKKQAKSGVEIKVHKDIIYCFDNESFGYLAAIKEIKFTQNEEQNLAESWKRSVDESLRLIKYLVKRQPHIVKDTLSLNNFRNTVLLLSRPFAEIERLIQKSIILIKEKQEEINNSSKTIEELKGKLYDIIDGNVELQISEIKSDQENKRAVIEVHQKRVDQLQKEWEKIKEISLKFTQFSRQNAIAAYNDAYVDYLDLCIKEEKIKRNANSSHYDERILRRLEATRENYLKQVEVIKQEIENNNSSITLKEIAKLEQQLYDLPINGPNLKKLKYEAERSETDVLKYTENHYMPPISNFMSNSFAEIFGKGW
ncbi:hypothetical protein RhiirA4_504556 [Rhizophagus irregularis]|uniref:SNTX MACPF/CDC-like domain-containing protein n=1 Tax=Rhizophagus irregularis TaxID=588596 RepID=A0A2I1H9L5_9GLOM|nr:hypothetical protein RhiirA4_504556 [Rhizophagus irregularis]